MSVRQFNTQTLAKWISQITLDLTRCRPNGNEKRFFSSKIPQLVIFRMFVIAELKENPYAPNNYPAAWSIPLCFGGMPI
jgi:hypothetical protein